MQNRISTGDDGLSSQVLPGLGRGQRAAGTTDPSIGSHQELLLLPPQGPREVVRTGNETMQTSETAEQAGLGGTFLES